MMQGRKKYQRRQWIRDQEIYFGTKNLMNTVVGDDNRITFRCFTPTGDDVVVKPDYTLRITPYSDMYLSVMFGNGGTQQIRAKGGTEYTIDCPLSSMDDTQVTIYGANRIQALSDLSACYIAANNFSMATKLRKLVLGNTTEGYSNSRLVSLTLGNNELLEELDIRNCSNLTGSINLSQCSNLLRLYAEGTKLTGVIFATNGKVQVAHLPETINTLTMRNLNDLVDFDATLSRLETLTLQGGTLNSLEIINNTINTLQVLYLYDINWIVADTVLLNKLLKLFYSLITGSVYVSGQIRQQELNQYAKNWNDLEVTYDSSQMVTQYLVTFVNYDGTVIYEQWVDRGSIPFDPIESGDIATPTKEHTPQYDFTFTGWDDLDSIVLAPRTITAQYSETIRSYTITWYSRPGISLGSKVAEYGSEVVYDGDIPTNTSEESAYIYNVFAGWDKSTGFIKEDVDVYAIWDRAELPALGTDLSEMTPAEIYAVTTSGRTENYFELKDYTDIVLGHDFNFKNVESVLLCKDQVFDGETAIDTNIQLFGEDAPSFTLAVDFRFTSTSANNTLISCYEEDGNEGFRLRYNSYPELQWGDKKNTFGYQKYRDIMVLRHTKGDDKLYIYASNSTAATSKFDDEITVIESTRNRSTNTNNILTLGGVKLPDGGHDYYGYGVIYWCKLWYDDLGDVNARQLASWYHETVRMEYCGTQRYRIGSSQTKCNASFIANNGLTDRLYYMNSTATNVGGWNECAMRKFVNNRAYSAIPTVWKSMIKNVRIPTSAGNKSTEIVYAYDNIYLESYTAFFNSTSIPYIDESHYIPWFTSNQLRGKFRGFIIPDDANYYTSSEEPSTNTANFVKPGDCWQPNGGENINYILVTAEDYERLPWTSTNNKHGTYTQDGLYVWITSNSFWLRSPYITSSQGFFGVSDNGCSTTYYANANAIIVITVCFSI